MVSGVSLLSAESHFGSAYGEKELHLHYYPVIQTSAII